MSKIVPLVGFGVGIMCVGFYWHFFNDAYTMFISNYVLSGYTAFGTVYASDKYFTFMYMLFRLIPWICVFVGVLLLFAAGASASDENRKVKVG